jgi:large subunit ribosomal protein L9
MQVILLQRIGRLGQMGDVVNVKNGYARNFLLPQKKALRATEENRKQFESQRAQLEADNLAHKSDADAIAKKLENQSFGQLYGSVSTRDIAETVTAGGFSINRNQVVLDKPIKNLGLHDVRIALHPEVVVGVKLNVARSEDEAARQAKGEDVTMVRDEKIELETFDPDSAFEDGAQPEAQAEGDEA